MINTQLGGKFSKEENGLFDLRRHLINAGINVQFPFNDGIIGEYNGIGVTFIPTPERTFYDIETEFFHAIKTNPIHIVHNKFKDQLGYIGESASIELGYAIIHNRPIVLLYPPILSDKVSPIIRDLLTRNIDLIKVERLDMLGTEELNTFISETLSKPVEYIIGVNDEVEIMKIIDALLSSYKEN